MPLQPGARLGRYEIVELRGKGGMGEVYRARDDRLDRDVALKVLPPHLSGDATFRRRLVREARTISRLQHPHVCALHDAGSEQGIDYLVMEYLEGETLEQRLRRGALPLPEVLRIGREIAEAIEAAHRRGIVHRDLKPGNVMLTGHGTKVLDFGLAKDVERAAVLADTQTPTLTGPLTEEGTLAGTVPYMAPEQLEGKAADARTDIWALGCVLYEMASGARPFRGAAQANLITAILSAEPEPVSQRQPIAPERLDWVIARCLEKSPARRWQSVADVGLELEALAEGAQSSARDARAAPDVDARGPLSSQWPAEASPPSSRSSQRWALAAAIAVLVALGAGAVWMLGPSGTVESPGERSSSAAAAAPRTLAVLPFEVIGPGDETGFVAGLTVEITTRLAANPGLRVTAYSGANQYAGTSKSAGQIGEELGVAHLLRGTVRRAGDLVRVSPELVLVADATTIWADPGDDRMLDVANLLDLQSEIAAHVYEQLGLTLGAPSAGVDRGTSSTEAYVAYLRGVDLASRPGRRSEDLVLAAQAFTQAVEHDERFALAWVGLSDAHGAIYFNERDPDRLPRAKDALDRALELEPELPEIQRSLGRHYLSVNDFERAREHLEIAARRLPSDPQVLVSLAQVHLRRGESVEYIVTLERALQLDPRSSDLLSQLGLGHSNLRRYEPADEYFRRAIDLAPENRFAHMLRRFNRVFWKGVEAYADPEPEILKGTMLDYWHFHIALSLGRFDDAQGIVDRGPRHGFIGSNAFLPKELFQGWIHAFRGETALAARRFEAALLACAAQLQEQPRDDRAETCLGHVYAGLGRKQEAIEHGERAVELWLSGQLAGYADPSARQYELAKIYAQVGKAERALDLLEEIMRRPFGAHPKTLEFDPFFAPLKDHPRYQALLPGAS